MALPTMQLLSPNYKGSSSNCCSIFHLGAWAQLKESRGNSVFYFYNLGMFSSYPYHESVLKVIICYI